MAQADKNMGNELGMKYDLQQILGQAEADFERSQTEMNRPSTDVVLYSACFFARRALHQYLFYFFNKYQGPIQGRSPHDITIEEMAEFCGKRNKEIAQVDFEGMHCSRSDVLEDEEVFFCNDVDKVGSCKNLAEQVRQAAVKE
ncbi:hypothetical protein QA596_02220 [Balneolales bacterium ANBcel1]|nr:hypothetical protein [Balneolales bacterium ANBcel1]